MAFCIKCGQDLVDGARFCSNCGSPTTNFANSNTRKTVFEGSLYKCPNCGNLVDAYETVCNVCKYEIRGRKATSVVYDLSLKLETTSDPQKRESLIRTFYIPNTREDIYEFFILALSNIKVGGNESDAWMVKLEQAYQKAELSFKGTDEFDRLSSLYRKSCSINRANRIRSFFSSNSKYLRSGYTWALLFFVIGFISMIATSFSESNTYLGGGLFIPAGAWIAIITYLINRGKKNG